MMPNSVWSEGLRKENERQVQNRKFLAMSLSVTMMAVSLAEVADEYYGLIRNGHSQRFSSLTFLFG